MYVILGETGHVGSSVAATLLEQGRQVTIITYDDKKINEWRKARRKLPLWMF